MLGILAALWAYLSALPPIEATRLAARVEGLQRFEPEALDIVRSESKGRRLGVHGDAGRVRGLVFYRAAVARGLLHLGVCEHHVPGDDGAAGWGIRGAHGLAAAYSVGLLGPCVAAEAVDVPFLSAVVTLRRLAVLEQRYRLATPAARALAWRVGVGRAKATAAP